MNINFSKCNENSPLITMQDEKAILLCCSHTLENIAMYFFLWFLIKKYVFFILVSVKMRYCCEGMFCINCPLTVSLVMFNIKYRLTQSLSMDCRDDTSTVKVNHVAQPGTYSVEVLYAYHPWHFSLIIFSFNQFCIHVPYNCSSISLFNLRFSYCQI